MCLDGRGEGGGQCYGFDDHVLQLILPHSALCCVMVTVGLLCPAVCRSRRQADRDIHDTSPDDFILCPLTSALLAVLMCMQRVDFNTCQPLVWSPCVVVCPGWLLDRTIACCSLLAHLPQLPVKWVMTLFLQ